MNDIFAIKEWIFKQLSKKNQVASLLMSDECQKGLHS